MSDKTNSFIILLLVAVVSITNISKEEFKNKNLKLEENIKNNEIIKKELLKQLDESVRNNNINNQEIKRLNETIKELKRENIQLKSTIQKPSRGMYSKNFIATAYCGCKICNGKWVGQPTASGTQMLEGRTIAVDPKIIPIGSVVHIKGIGNRVAEDTGSAIKGKIIDIYFNSHEEAKNFGRRKVDLRIVS